MPYTATVITVSDRAYNREYVDQSGPAVYDLLSKAGYHIESVHIIPDEKNKIIETLRSACGNGVNLIVTTGGTGKSFAITPRAMLSRGIAGICKDSLVINLPGSPKGAVENLSFILPHLSHGLDMLNGVKES